MCVLILPTNPQNILLKRTKSLDFCYRRVIKRLPIHPTFWCPISYFDILKLKCQWLLGCKIVFTEVALHYPSFQSGYAGPEKVVSCKLSNIHIQELDAFAFFIWGKTPLLTNQYQHQAVCVCIFPFMHLCSMDFFKIKTCLVKKGNGFLYQKVQYNFNYTKWYFLYRSIKLIKLIPR